MSMKNRFQNWFYLDEEDEGSQPQKKSEEKQPVKEKKPRVNNRKKEPVVPEERKPANVVSLQSAQKSSKVFLVEPRVYAEAQDIAEQLKNKRAVVVNLQRIDRDQGIRIVDFLSGTVYALGGDIQRIGTDIFLCVPENVEVDGAISDYFEK